MAFHLFWKLQGETFYERRWKKEQKALGRSKPRWLKSKFSVQIKVLASLGKDAVSRARTNIFERLNLAPCSKEASSLRRPLSYDEWDHGSSTSLSTSVSHYLQTHPCRGPLYIVNPDMESYGGSLRNSASNLSSEVSEKSSPSQGQFLSILGLPLPRRPTAATREKPAWTGNRLKHKTGNAKELACLAGNVLANPNVNGEPAVRRPLPNVPLLAPKPKARFLLTVDADNALFGSVADRGSSRGPNLGLPLPVFGGSLLPPLDLSLPASSNESRPWDPSRVRGAALQLPQLLDDPSFSPFKNFEATQESFPRFDGPLLSPLGLFIGLPPTFREPNTDTQGNFQNVTQPQAQRAQLHLFLAKQKCEPWVERQNTSTEHTNFGTALGSAYSSLRYSSARFEPRFSLQPSPPARTPWTALHDLKSVADGFTRHLDPESALADDLLYLSTLEFRKPHFITRNSYFPLAPGSRQALEVPEEEEEEEEEKGEDKRGLSSLPSSYRANISCHLSGRNVSIFLQDLHAQHLELLDKPDSPVKLDSSAKPAHSWTSGDETTFTVIKSQRKARAGVEPSEEFSKWSFMQQRNRHRRFHNRELGVWRWRLRIIKSLRRRLAEEEAALRALFR